MKINSINYLLKPKRIQNFSVLNTVCPGSSDPQEKILNIFVSENEVYTIFQLIRFFRFNYSITEQNKFRSHELDCIKQFDSIF